MNAMLQRTVECLWNFESHVCMHQVVGVFIYRYFSTYIVIIIIIIIILKMPGRGEGPTLVLVTHLYTSKGESHQI